MKKTTVFAIAFLLASSAVSTSHAIVGAGFHWGVDLSLSMDNVRNEALSVPGAGDAFSVSRTNWERSAINFGGKAYIDFIPILPIDAIELSCNFGMWQYDGVLHVDIPGVGSRDIKLGVDDVGLSAIGVGGTPYAKLHFDATLRKQLLNLLLVKFDAGIGYSLHFATPILDANFVEGIIAKSAGSSDIGDFMNSLNDPDAARKFGKDIVKKLQDESMGLAAHGMHVMLGVKAKLPVIPVGVYLDGKYMIPFSDDISNAKKGVNGFGFLVNAGISLSI